MLQRARQRFQPDVLRGGDRAALNAGFRREVETFALAWRCADCTYFDRPRLACSVGWPTAGLLEADTEILDDQDHVRFCKAFEAFGA